MDRREKVSFDAMELINSLLQEKEHRLSSRKYQLNDYDQSRRVPGIPGSRVADLFARDYQGNYVYPDDATDIKAHHFFRRISWDRLHLTRPPFVPDVSGGDDTKYFDEEEPISDVDDAASYSHTIEASDQGMNGTGLGTAYVSQVDGPQGLDAVNLRSVVRSHTNEKRDPGEGIKARERKRPRDKVLRDRDVGKKALELRKKGAFLGYTYRRPNPNLLIGDRGKEAGTQTSEISSFD